MVVPINLDESLEFLVMIQQMVYRVSCSGCLEFVLESNIHPSVGLDVSLLGIPDISFPHL